MSGNIISMGGYQSEEGLELRHLHLRIEVKTQVVAIRSHHLRIKHHISHHVVLTVLALVLRARPVYLPQHVPPQHVVRVESVTRTVQDDLRRCENQVDHAQRGRNVAETAQPVDLPLARLHEVTDGHCVEHSIHESLQLARAASYLR